MPDNKPQLPGTSLAQIGLGAISSVIGLAREKGLKKEAERLAESRPDYEISELAGQELSLAKSELGGGLSAGAKAYMELNNNQFSNTISSLLKGGGNVNSIGAIYGNNETGRLRLAQMEDEMRLRKINNLVTASDKYQTEQQTAWQVNKFAPWQDKAQANAEARTNNDARIWGGANSVAAGIGGTVDSVIEQNRLRDPFFAGTNPSTTTGLATGVTGNTRPTGQMADTQGMIDYAGNPYATRAVSGIPQQAYVPRGTDTTKPITFPKFNFNQ